MENQEYPAEYHGLKIDPIIFTQGFVPGCDIGICKGQCCDWGVSIDKNYKEIIMMFKDKIKDVMTEDQIKDDKLWFDNEEIEDCDFTTGFSISTELYKDKQGNEKCIFKDKNNYCSIQVMSIKHNMHKWSIKPKYCIFYPLTIEDNVLTYDTDHSVALDYCGIHHQENFSQPVFEAMREEIIFVLGDECYTFLYDYYVANYKQKFQIQIPKTIHKTNIR
jgi:hypothetical protein